MGKFNCALIILNILITSIAANQTDCVYVETVALSELYKISADVCFSPEKLIIVNDIMCVDRNNQFAAAINTVAIDDDGTDYVPYNFVIKPDYETRCERYFNFEDALVRFQWGLEYGELVIYVPGVTMNKLDYCLKLVDVEGVPNKVIKPYICGLPTNTLNVYIRGLSVFCMLLSVYVYLFLYLPRYDSVHNKCCSRYMICKTITFTLRSIDAFYLHTGVLPATFLCVLVFFFSYFFVLATFVWLLTINYNIWKLLTNLRTITCHGEFQKLNKFVWLFTCGLVILSVIVDDLFRIGRVNEWTTQISLLSCYLISYDWSAIALLHGPIIVILLINLTLAIRTARHMYLESAQDSRDLSETEFKNQIKNKANFLFFFRLFLFTGAFSILDKVFTIFIITGVLEHSTLDFAEPILCLQGVLLFVITVLRREVIKAVRNSFRGKKTVSSETEVIEM